MSGDPNADGPRRARADRVRGARGPLVDDRNAFVVERARGLDVLDVGCVNHDAATSEDAGWLHGDIVRAARSCLGLDILEVDVGRLRAKGYDVLVHDITRSPLDRRFDLVVCGEIIEHVGSPENLLRNCRDMLSEGGALILSTPNPWYANFLLKALFSREPIVDNVEHVAWFEPAVLAELAERAGLVLESFHGIRVTGHASAKSRLFFRMMPLWQLLGVQREVFAKSIIYVLRRGPAGGGG